MRKPDPLFSVYRGLLQNQVAKKEYDLIDFGCVTILDPEQ
jgi:hypothetical protein